MADSNRIIISDNRSAEIPEFRKILITMDNYLNDYASRYPKEYLSHNGTLLEKDVYEMLTLSAHGTPFENTIHLISGASFPDIVVDGYYGVEVKSTKENKWKSIGSSILESTRVKDIERVFLTFGKLYEPVQFKTRPYEECLSDISVTHYPRYQIDMELNSGETIFDKIGIPYDSLRNYDNPVEPVAKYYRDRLKPGESLWWAPAADVETTSSPLKLKTWTAYSRENAQASVYFRAKGFALFPEVFKSDFEQFGLWLISEHGIYHRNVRDLYTAGGKVNISCSAGNFYNLPAIYGHLHDSAFQIKETIRRCPEEDLKYYWKTPLINSDRLKQWFGIVTNSISLQDYDVRTVLEALLDCSDSEYNCIVSRNGR